MIRLCCEVVLVPLYRYRGDNTTLSCAGIQHFTTFHMYNLIGEEAHFPPAYDAGMS